MAHIDSPAPETLPGLRVLVVDDDQDAADSLAILLGLWGHRPRVAYTPEAALLAVAARPPDVVLLDLGLPGTDGFELAAGLRARDGMKDAVFIAITGHTLPKYRERARECRFTDVLIKPYEPEFLRGLLADQQAMRTREQLEAGEPRGRVTATAGRSG